ncbi:MULTISPECIES: hypothetical protein [unclassified Blastococcus]
MQRRSLVPSCPAAPCRAAGWTVVLVTAEDLTDPVQLLARIAAALRLVH